MAALDTHELTSLIDDMYRADAVAQAIDTIRRGFDLTEEEIAQLAAFGVDASQIEQEFGHEFLS